MTLSRTLTRGRLSALNISPAVLPGPKPISSSTGDAVMPSKQNASGNTVEKSDALISQANAAGVATLVFSGPPPGFKWKVERASVGSQQGHFTTCEVHAGAINTQNKFLTLVDVTTVPNSAVADEASPIFVGPGQPLTFVFNGGTVGDDATARIQYVEEAL